VLFLHTGVSTALFDYRSTFHSARAARTVGFDLSGAVPAAWSVEGVVEGGGL
jgi:hypothetical protein